MKTKQTVNLAQHHNPKRVTQDQIDAGFAAKNATLDPDEYIYKVLSLKNTLTPAVGEYIRAKEVQRLISEGVDVNISPLK